MIERLVEGWEVDLTPETMQVLLTALFVGDDETGYCPVACDDALAPIAARALLHATFTTSLVRCVTWCDLPTGHAYEIEAGAGALERTHERVVSQDGDAARATVEQVETSLSAAGPAILEAAARTRLSGGTTSDAELVLDSPADCRALARALFRAAELMEATAAV